METTSLKQRIASSVPGALLALFAINLLFGASIAGCHPTAQNDLDTTALFQVELDALRQEYGFPGATAAFVLSDGTAGVVATGLSDVEAGVRMSPSSRMLAASIGKTFVSATALALSQEGRLDIDERISLWLGDEPWFARLPNHELITIRHLLTHSAGIPNHVDEPAFAAAFAESWAKPGTPVSHEMLIEFVLDRPALFAPGEGWSYSDTGYIVVGLVIEKVTGRSYYKEVNERFLEPLDLSLTSPSDRHDLPGLAAGYMSAENKFGLPSKTTVVDGRMAWNPAIEWTGGGLVSNSLDIAKWAKALFEGRAMEGPYLEDLLRAVPISAEVPDVSFGAGVGIHNTGPIGAWYSHGGWIPGYSSSLRYYPEHRVAIAFQINTDIGIVDDSTALYEEMAARLEQVIASAETE
jgi:D-alanyl-D-alanine carboxypeptidase